MEKVISHPAFGDILYTKRAGCGSIRISIHPVRGIRVSLPFYLAYGRAVRFVEENEPKILKSLERLRKKAENRIDLPAGWYGAGSVRITLGRKIVFGFLPEEGGLFGEGERPVRPGDGGGPEGGAELGKEILIRREPDRYAILYPDRWGERPVPGSGEERALREAYRAVLRREAKLRLPERTAGWASRMERFIRMYAAGEVSSCRGDAPVPDWQAGCFPDRQLKALSESMGRLKPDSFRYNRIAIKDNRSNWGSCSAKKNLNLNLHLMELPPELADFVIVHELCHLAYPDHGPRFHALVDAVFGGNEKMLEKQLKKYRLIG